MLGMVPTAALFNDPGRNKEPDPDAEYIYNDSVAWERDEKTGKVFLKSTPVTSGSIVVKVRKGDYEQLFFEFKDQPGKTWATNYGWAFVLNTPENAQLYQEWLDRREKISELSRINKKLFKNTLITLDNQP